MKSMIFLNASAFSPVFILHNFKFNLMTATVAALSFSSFFFADQIGPAHAHHKKRYPVAVQLQEALCLDGVAMPPRRLTMPALLLYLGSVKACSATLFGPLVLP